MIDEDLLVYVIRLPKKTVPPSCAKLLYCIPDSFFHFRCTQLTSQDGIPKIQYQWELQLPRDRSLIPLVETGDC